MMVSPFAYGRRCGPAGRRIFGRYVEVPARDFPGDDAAGLSGQLTGAGPR